MIVGSAGSTAINFHAHHPVNLNGTTDTFRQGSAGNGATVMHKRSASDGTSTFLSLSGRGPNFINHPNAHIN